MPRSFFATCHCDDHGDCRCDLPNGQRIRVSLAAVYASDEEGSDVVVTVDGKPVETYLTAREIAAIRAASNHR
jgi:hypothetical protein